MTERFKHLRAAMRTPRFWSRVAVVFLCAAVFVGQLTAISVVLERGDRLRRQDRVNDQLRAEVASLQQSLQCVAGKTAAYDVALGDSVAAFEQALIASATDRTQIDYERLARTARDLATEVEKRRQTAQSNPPAETPPVGSGSLCTTTSTPSSVPHG